MPLIDANEAYEIARSSGRHNDFGRCMADLTSLKELLEDCTAVDAVEVVRCKDCKHWSYIPGLDKCPHCRVFCGLHSKAYPTKSDDFCSYGERRE